MINRYLPLSAICHAIQLSPLNCPTCPVSITQPKATVYILYREDNAGSVITPLCSHVLCSSYAVVMFINIQQEEFWELNFLM